MLKLYVSLQNMLEGISRNEEGQTAVEYGLVLAIIAVAVVVGMKTGLVAVGGTVVTKVTNAVTSAS